MRNTYRCQADTSVQVQHQKKFIIIGNQNAIKYKEVFPLFMQNKVWLGASIHSGDRAFFVPDDLIDLIYRLKRPYRAKACFITADSTLAQIRKMKDDNGQSLWQPGMTAGEPDRLLGFPVHTSAYFPRSGAGKPVIAFGDFSYYNVADRGNRSFRALTELYAGNGHVGIVSTECVDGKLVLPEAVQALKMAGTASEAPVANG